jgi:predicted amino acid-binding ACT domain protein
MPEKYLLASIVGPDRSGLITEITSTIADFGYSIEDMDQVVMHGIFVFSMLINISHGQENLESLKKKLEQRCRELGLEVVFYYPGRK